MSPTYEIYIKILSPSTRIEYFTGKFLRTGVNMRQHHWSDKRAQSCKNVSFEKTMRVLFDGLSTYTSVGDF